MINVTKKISMDIMKTHKKYIIFTLPSYYQNEIINCIRLAEEEKYILNY